MKRPRLNEPGPLPSQGSQASIWCNSRSDFRVVAVSFACLRYFFMPAISRLLGANRSRAASRSAWASWVRAAKPLLPLGDGAVRALRGGAVWPLSAALLFSVGVLIVGFFLSRQG